MSDGATARAVPAYADAVARFSIETAAKQLHGDLERGLNACVECCDRHASADAVALDWIDAGGQHHRYTFAQMKALSARVANLLVAQGVKPGD
ncbi:TPA: AMP-binding protein, partial [Burkholderia contaminans]